MQVTWDWGVIPGLVALVLGWTLAAVVYRAHPRRMQNRVLALLLAVDACWIGGFFGVLPLLDAPGDARAYWGMHLAIGLATTLLYPAFLGTLDSPLARPFRPRAVRVALVVLALAALPLWPVLSRFFVAEEMFEIVHHGQRYWAMTSPGIEVFLFANLAVLLYGLAVAVHAWRRSPHGTAARAQGTAYALAFGVRDGVLGASLFMYIFLLGEVAPWVDSVRYYFAPLSQVWFCALLAYGFLRSQLFDIDLRVKWGIRRGTVVGAFLVAFFVASSIAEQYLERYGLVVGGVAVGLLLVAVRPLERAAERLADRAMPQVQDTPEYRLVKKREVYRAAVEGALEDGGVSDKERAMLARLAEQLGLGPVEMHAIEQETRTAKRDPATATGVAH